jgi:hypothetical protein
MDWDCNSWFFAAEVCRAETGEQRERERERERGKVKVKADWRRRAPLFLLSYVSCYLIFLGNFNLTPNVYFYYQLSLRSFDFIIFTSIVIDFRKYHPSTSLVIIMYWIKILIKIVLKFCNYFNVEKLICIK